MRDGTTNDERHPHSNRETADGMRQGVLALEDAGDRLDRVLARLWPDLSRSRLQVLIRAGALTLDGVVTTDPSRAAVPGAAVALLVPPPVAAEPAAEAIPLDVVYEDDQIILLDKPAGLVVHPAAGHADGTLVNALIAHCGESLSGIGGVRRPGIVHRLDKDTSGLLVVAKTDAAHQALAAQFADHGRTGALRRAYLALVWGEMPGPRGTVDAPIDRDPRHREKMAIARGGRGRHAVTHWERLAAYADAQGAPVASLVRCTLETGRTHQIRVHMAHIGHPLLGDAVYGAGFRSKAARLGPVAQEALVALDRQALHAAHLTIAHPGSGAVLSFERAPPADFQALQVALETGE